jgi:trehalose-6-phosphate synthase
MNMKKTYPRTILNVSQKKPLQCIHPFPAPQIVNCSEHFAMRRQLLHNLLEARLVAFVG